jgi:hypothetical protein
MSRAWFKPMIIVFHREKAFRALDGQDKAFIIIFMVYYNLVEWEPWLVNNWAGQIATQIFWESVKNCIANFVALTSKI